ncbi:hypothetical protein [Sneathiella limimaris]|uniref:flagellar biosynthesis protein FlhF n=1 Tax=Sneathiella limimaris TaxID=1964213 RepID=UPI00146C57ED|nr:hypothetical protein [Sneathiella limimaris]
MRIKSFTGKDMADAMTQVRNELGDDAIILSTQDLPSGEAQVTAAIEKQDPAPPTYQPKKSNGWAMDWDSDWRLEAEQPHEKRKTLPKRVIKKKTPEPVAAAPKASPAKADTAEPEDRLFLRQKAEQEVKPKAAPKQARAKTSGAQPIQVTPQVETLVQAMAFHGVPTLLAERIIRTAISANTDDTNLALAASLDEHFNFAPKFTARNKPLMLVGPPGVGKTMTIAKMAASATVDGRPVHVITTDKSRAGAVDQLKAFTDILKLKLWVTNGADGLPETLAKKELRDGAHILIDTGGINCYEMKDLEELADQIIASGAETLAVLPAGLDAAEMSDTAAKLSSIGARRLLITRLDTTRRYGGVLTAADKAGLSFSYASVSPAVATGLHVLTPVNLARLILRDPTQQGVSSEFDKVQK